MPLPESLLLTNLLKPSASAPPFPTLNISTIPVFSISPGIFPSVNASAYPFGSVSARPPPFSNYTIIPTAPSSGFLPLPTFNLTTGFNASVSGRLPPPFLNGTGRPLYPATRPITLPTPTGTHGTAPISGGLVLPTKVILPSSNIYPIPTLSVSRSSSHVTFSSTSRATPFDQLAHELPVNGCPSINDTIYTVPYEGGDRDQLQCSIEYTGCAFSDLDGLDLEGCIGERSDIDPFIFASGLSGSLLFMIYF